VQALATKCGYSEIAMTHNQASNNREPNLRAALGALIAVTLASIALVLFTDGDKKTLHGDHVPSIAQGQR
jgi:hypothetical protein